jgi:hypothetical protein
MSRSFVAHRITYSNNLTGIGYLSRSASCGAGLVSGRGERWNAEPPGLGVQWDALGQPMCERYPYVGLLSIHIWVFSDKKTARRQRG